MERNLRRLELEGVGLANETNRFLNWVRLTHAPGEAAWVQASVRAPEMRRAEVARLGEEWAATTDSKVPAVYIPWLDNVRRVFGDREQLGRASRESHDFLYDPKRKVQHIGRFTALELYGTVRPDDCPPVNGRMAKALRYLGYDVLAA